MLEGMDSYEIAFWVCAIAGTTLFFLKSLLLIVGGMDHELDIDSNEIAQDGLDSSDAAFKLLSINSITGFFMMFGWVGLACYVQAELIPILSLFGGTIAGLITMYLTAKLFQGARHLISNGSQFIIENTVGKTGSVYQEIPENGSGKIQITVDGITREIDAISADNQSINSFTTIEVVSVLNPTTVAVKQK